MKRKKWYLIAYLCEDKWNIEVNSFLFTKKEMLDFMVSHIVISISKITREQATAYNQSLAKE